MRALFRAVPFALALVASVASVVVAGSAARAAPSKAAVAVAPFSRARRLNWLDLLMAVLLNVSG